MSEKIEEELTSLEKQKLSFQNESNILTFLGRKNLVSRDCFNNKLDVYLFGFAVMLSEVEDESYSVKEGYSAGEV